MVKNKEPENPFADAQRTRILRKFFAEAAWNEDRDAKITVIPTSSFALNYILGIGGIPLGRVVQLAGAESSGKTTLCMDLMRRAENLGYSFLFFDAEQTYSAELASSIGIKTPPSEYMVKESRAAVIWSKLIGPHKGLKKQEGVLCLDSEIGHYFLKEKNLKLVFIDSLNSLVVPRVENSDLETQQVGALSAFLSQNLPLLVPKLAFAGVTLVGVQQLRSKIGVSYGDPTTTSGGRAWKHDVSVSINLTPSESKDYKILDGEGAVVGTSVTAYISKSKVSRPYMKGQYKVIFGQGIIEPEREVFDIALRRKVIAKPSNATYEFEGTTWRGEKAVLAAIASDESLRDKLVASIHARRYEILGGERDPAPPVGMISDDQDI